MRFEDVTRKSGIWRPQEEGGPYYGFQALFTDLDNDGWPDVYVANDSCPSLCFLNRRDGTFRECGKEVGVALSDTGQDMAGMGALTGAFWGMLFGLIFFVPLLGMAIGAGMGALAGALADTGIDDKFIKQVQSQVTPGTSALFLMTSGAVMDRVLEAVHKQGLHPELISSNLSAEQEAKLREVFAEED